ncbi:MAG TPA: antibiotic biosynthesis monooxygenase [Bacteroidia bacterium]|nr:antibiotic biosynthesis monooxygenase [Bacteroidia bacterium]
MIRIVKLEIKLDRLQAFQQHLAEVKDRIASFPGCTHLEIYQHLQDKNILFTYSHWNSENDLNAYLQSELFISIWSNVKPMFLKPAQAWSVDELKF